MRNPAMLTALVTLVAAATLSLLSLMGSPPKVFQVAIGLPFLLFAPASGWIAALSIRPMWISGVLTLLVSLTLCTLAALCLSYFDAVTPLKSIGFATLLALSGQVCWWVMRRRGFERKAKW